MHRALGGEGVERGVGGVSGASQAERSGADCKVQQVLPLAVPGLEGARHLVLIGLEEPAQ